MKIEWHSKFQKNYKKRIATNKNLTKTFNSKLNLFIKNTNHPLLKSHKLSGNKSGYHAFSITGDIRVIYKIEKGEIKFYDIGTHNQVY